MSIIRIKKRKNPFVQIDKRPIEDSHLSWKAKGLLAYLLSKPDDWVIRIPDLVKRSQDGRASCRSGLQELESNGYISKKRLRNDNGVFTKMEYKVYETPKLGKKQSRSSFNSNKSTNGKSSSGQSTSGESTSGQTNATNNNSSNNEFNDNESTTFERFYGVPIPENLKLKNFKEKYSNWWDYLREQWNRDPNIHTIQAQLQLLVELKEKGNDPLEVISQSIRNMNKSFYPIRKGFNQEGSQEFESKGIANADAYTEYDG